MLFRSLRGGSDQIGAIDDLAYIGVDDANPELRTGLNSLRNYEEISIVAAPGCTGAQIQGALSTTASSCVTASRCSTRRPRRAIP